MRIKSKHRVETILQDINDLECEDLGQDENLPEDNYEEELAAALTIQRVIQFIPSTQYMCVRICFRIHIFNDWFFILI